MFLTADLLLISKASLVMQAELIAVRKEVQEALANTMKSGFKTSH